MKILKVFIRVFIVIFCFTMDVKVKADVTVEEAHGHVEFQHGGQIFARKELSKLPMTFADSVEARDLDVQTFDGTLRFKMDNKKVGVDRGSVFSVDQDGVGQLSQGDIFFSISKGKVFKIQTPQGAIETENGDFFLEITGGKSQVSVLSGLVTVIDRASKKSIDVSAGYATWLGGLLATGFHAHPVRPQAIDLERVMGASKILMGWSEKEFEVQNKIAILTWKNAVLKVADDSQSAIDSDIKTLNLILENEQKFEKQKSLDQARLRKLFREKTEGVPEIGRAPTSDFQ